MKNLFNKIGSFLREVREEILKCARPSTEELKESTTVMVATMIMLGVFIFASDIVIGRVLKILIVN